MKFVGFQVKNDHTSLAGLPQPIHEGVKVLKQVGLDQDFIDLVFVDIMLPPELEIIEKCSCRHHSSS